MAEDQSAQEAMSILDDVKEKLSDSEYKSLAEALASINPNKDFVVEYPADLQGVVTIATTSAKTHIGNLKRRLITVSDKYQRDTRKYLIQISDLSAEMLRLKKEWDEEDEDDDEDE
tara:strand:- start:379 stop:726 length:348 start_codon:yes stop_codon:yes gene_type:complete